MCRLYLSGLLFIWNGVGRPHNIVGVGVISQGEAGAGAGHLIPVQGQRIYRLKGLVINQSYLLLTDTTACRCIDNAGSVRAQQQLTRSFETCKFQP